jgi:hypothetical protein
MAKADSSGAQSNGASTDGLQARGSERQRLDARGPQVHGAGTHSADSNSADSYSSEAGGAGVNAERTSRKPIEQRARLVIGAACALMLANCGGPHPTAFKNKVFYDYGADGVQDLSALFETHYPPLDLGPVQPNPEYRGVTILNGLVRFSRPINWRIRRASNDETQRFVEYVSPRQYMVSIYERTEPADAPWHEVMKSYEEQVKADGAQIIGKPYPGATWNSQARVYDVERSIKAPKRPLKTFSREYLARGKDRIVLIQVVHPEATLEPIGDELLRVMTHLQVQPD